MEETREALVQKLLDIYSKEGNYETSVPGVWVHRSERNKVPKPHIYQPMMIFILSGTKLIKFGSAEKIFSPLDYFLTVLTAPVTSRNCRCNFGGAVFGLVYRFGGRSHNFNCL